MLVVALSLGCTSAGTDTARFPACHSPVAPGTSTPAGTLEPTCACLAPVVEVGTGELVFSPLEDGDELRMVHGPQGGWHLLGAVRLTGFRTVVDVRPSARIGELPITAELSYRNLLEPEGPCVGTMVDLFLYLDTYWLVEAGEPTGTPAELISCRDVTMEICARDSDGRDECDTVELRVLPDRTDVATGLVDGC